MITLTAVRNDGKQPDIKGADTNELLKSSPRISKISHLDRVKQHGTSVTALKARTMCREERDLGPVSVSGLLLEITWGDCLKQSGPLALRCHQKHPEPESSSAFSRGPSHCEDDSGHIFKSNANSFTKLGNGLGKSLVALGPMLL